jgi:hypothetical protein
MSEGDLRQYLHDNYDVAVMIKLNELTERHSLRACDYVTTLHKHIRQPGNWLEYELRFETPATGNALLEQRFDKMINDLGVSAEGTLIASAEGLLDSLDRAISAAPKPRLRF